MIHIKTALQLGLQYV